MLNWIMLGGPTMWIILLCGLAAAVIFLERLLHLHRAQINFDVFLQGIRTNLNRGHVLEAVTICEDTPGPVARMVQAAITHHDESEDRMRDAMIEAGRMEVPRLEKNLLMLGTLAKVAPLLGLFGTLLGLIQAVMTLEMKAPLIHSGDLASGLWRALITSAAGFAVAIPAYTAHNFLVGRVESIINDMETAALRIVHFVLREWNTESKDRS